MKALDLKLLRDLFHLRGQVIAIALIVACGIAGMVTMISAYNSLKLSQATYYDRYRFAQVFVQLKRAPESLVQRIEEIPEVRQVRTRVVVDVTLDVPGLEEPATGRLVSIPEQPRPILNDLYIRRGRYIQPGRRDEVLVSEAFAEANQLDLGDTLGAVINGRWERLRIVGVALSPEYVYEIKGSDFLPDNKRFGILWTGRDALGSAFDLDGAFNDVAISLMPRARESEVLFQLDQLLERYGGLGAYGREDQVSNRFLSDEISQLKVNAVFVPSIFLGIAAFLLNIVLARLVSTQRDQIAVFKAFGYDNLSIGMHYLKFVLAIMLVGAGGGTALGLWFGSGITQYYTNFFHFPVLRYEAGVGLIATSILVTGSAAILGAFTALSKAVALPPAEAMRPESPPRYQPTFIERMGLQRFFSPAGRIILRNLERKQIQALLSVLGIALAVAILVVGRYGEDAINHIVEVQFRNVQREDVTIVFNEPRPNRTRYELNHLPGVIRSEPFRTVPARLRFEHRTHRSGITGLDSAGELRRLIDRNLDTVNLPPDGVVLTKKLAEILGVNIGEKLAVEVLEGERPIRQVPVVGLVDELIGVGAYMDISALNRLMREGRTISGAYLMVDPHYNNQLYSLLKKTPAITGVSIRQRAIAKFEETIAASFVVFMTVLVIFACIIAFGVVYNSARIALSERSRELATLRIIGFTRGEIAFILLGEQAILTIVAIPLGFAIGFGLVALMSSAYNSELYRFPLIVTRASYMFAFLVVMTAAFFSGLLIRRQLNRLDLVAVLKTRE
ncbi:MAG: ABC transporter permease [Symploca sp. SIO2E9]|nr:ABC transporter permease [Symploca sp. SIO2E9]